jgi:hypothetical protein
MKTFQQIKDEIQSEREKCRLEAWDSVGRKGFLKSRGSYVYVIREGNVIAGEGESIDFEGTKKQIQQLIEKYNGCTIDVSGGFDYASSPKDYYEYGDYDPWVGDWSVTVFQSAN